MQTPFSQPTPFPELFTRERRRTRMRQFLDSFENDQWKQFASLPDLLPIKLSAEPQKSTTWTEESVR